MNKKYILASALAALTLISATGCNEAKRVRENLAQEADNFNCYRQITVINCITGAATIQIKLIFLTPLFFKQLTASIALPPVANIASIPNSKTAILTKM